MKIKNYFIIPFIVCMTIIYADSNIYNQIENDHRIRNFAFIGPFPKDYNADSLIKTISSNDFSLKNSVMYKEKTYNWIKPPAATGSNGSHSIWHYYRDIKVEEIVIGAAIVNSKTNQNVITTGNEWYCRSSRYINGKIVFDPRANNGGGIHISESTKVILKDRYKYQLCTNTEIKGIGIVNTYLIV